jgi:hypothetical protein
VGLAAVVGGTRAGIGAAQGRAVPGGEIRTG